MSQAVKIDFFIGGSDAVQRMIQSVSKSAQLSAKEQMRVDALRAKELVKVQSAAAKAVAVEHARANEKMRAEGAKHVAKLNEIALKGHVKNSEAQTRLAAKTATETAKIHERAERDKMRSSERRAAQETRIARQRDVATQRNEERTVKERSAAFGGTLSAAGQGAANGVRSLVRGGAAVGNIIAQGVGFDPNAGSSYARTNQKRASALDLVNSATSGNGEKTAAMRVAEAKALVDMTDKVGSAHGKDSAGILEGGQRFVAATGDLEAFKGLMEELAVASNATGAKFEDLAQVAGKLGTKMPKAEVMGIVRMLAQQGKVGSIELKDQINGAPQLGGLAGLFGGPKDKAISGLGALAQIAIEKGTVGDASEAFTAVRAFANSFSKKARRKAAKGMGIETEDADGQLVSPEEILARAVVATKGDKVKLLGDAFADTRSHPLIHAARNAYLEAGGGGKGEAGEKAVRALFTKYTGTSMSKAEEKAASDAVESSDVAKAKQAQIKFDKVIADLADKVIPSMIKLAPVAERLAGALSGLVDSAVNHPWSAIGAVIMGSIVKEIAAAKIAGALAGGGGAGGAGAAGGGAIGTGLLAFTGGLAVGGAAAYGIDSDMVGKQKTANEWQSYGINAISNANAGDKSTDAMVNMMAEREMNGGAVNGFLTNAMAGATAGYRGLASGDLSASNFASAIPLVAAGRGIVQGVTGAQQDAQTNKELDTNIAALQVALDKPTVIAPGAVVNIGNIADFPKAGADAARSHPIEGPF